MARVGGARVFFDVVGRFQAQNMLAETKEGFQAMSAITSALMIDTLSGIQDAFTLVGDQVRALVDETVPLAQKVAEARIEFDKFARNIEDFEILRESIKSIGQAYGFTADEALKAGARTAQLSGILKSQGAIAEATEAGIQFAFIGGMETETAMLRLIQLQQQTGFMYGNLTQEAYAQASAFEQQAAVAEGTASVLNQLNTIENRSAATMSQLTFVMNQFASSAQLAGDSIADMAAMSAAMIEAGEEQGKAGRAMRIIYARLGANTNDNNMVLRRYIGTIRDASGNMKPMMEIMGDLDKQWDSLGEAERTAIAQAVAGNDHYVRFLKLMNNYDRAVTLSSQAMAELDKATDEVALFTEDPARQLEMTRNRIKDLKAEIGDELIPTMNAAAEAEERVWKGALLIAENMGFDDEFTGKLMAATKMFSMIAGTGLETYINMKNISVAMRTQAVLIKAIEGAEIGRKKRTDAQVAAQLSTNATLRDTEVLSYKISMIEANIANQKAQGLYATDILKNKTQEVALANEAVETLLQNQLSLAQMLAEAEEGVLTQAERKLQSYRAIHNTVTLLSAEQLALFTQEQQNLEGNIITAETFIGKLARVNHEIKLGGGAFEALEMTGEQAFQEITMRADALNQEIQQFYMFVNMTDQEITQYASNIGREMGKSGQELRKNTIELKKQFMTIRDEGPASFLGLEAALKDYIKDLREAFVVNEQFIAGHQEASAAMQKESQDVMDLALAMDNLRQTQSALDMVTALLTNDLKEEDLAIEELNNAITRLTALKAQLTRTEYDNAKSIAANTAELEKNSIAAQKNAQKMQTANSVLGMFTMSASVASMGIMLFGDKLGLDEEESAAAGLIAMGIAMVPAIIQMGVMTAEMLVAAGAAATLTSALWMTAAAMGGIGLLVVGISTIAAKAMTSKKDVDHLNESLAETDRLIASITGEDIQEKLLAPDFFKKALENAGMGEIAALWADPMSMGADAMRESIQEQEDLIDSLTDKVEDSQGIQREAYQRQLDMMKELNIASEARLNFLTAEEILAGDLSHSMEEYVNWLTKNHQINLSNEAPGWDSYAWEIASLSFSDENEGTKYFNELESEFARVGARWQILGQEHGKEYSDAQVSSMLENISDGLQSYNFDDETGTWSETVSTGLGGGATVDYSLSDEELELLRFMRGQGLTDDMVTAGGGLGNWWGSWDDVSSKMSKERNEYLAEASEMGYISTEAAQAIVDAFGPVPEAVIEPMSEAITQTQETLGEFESSMQEFFYGGDYRMLQGDLVKQVINKGAENLLVNTEVHQTNIFNGMTLPEIVSRVADSIMSEIESRGGVSA